MNNAYLGVDTRRGQLVLTDHDEDAKHAHDEGVVTDPFPLLEKGFPPAQTMRQVAMIVAYTSETVESLGESLHDKS